MVAVGVGVAVREVGVGVGVAVGTNVGVEVGTGVAVWAKAPVEKASTIAATVKICCKQYLIRFFITDLPPRIYYHDSPDIPPPHSKGRKAKKQ
jgi:hypothetical protein